MADVSTINFVVNGKPYSVNNPEVGTSLNSWLRSCAELTGTKAMCKEGGCGSCVVMLTRSDPVTGTDGNIAINSCLFPLLSADGCHITTTEGLIQNGGKYDAVQERIAHFNGTQCGYCTPGFVMTMHSLLTRNPNATQEEIEAEFDGNICRCTGFRSILDAMKSFASDADPKLKKICADIEDLKVCNNVCSSDSKPCKRSCGRYHADGVAPLLHKDDDCSQEDWLALVAPKNIRIQSNSALWLRPTTLQQLTTDVANNQSKSIRFVVGNTATGVFKNDGPYDVYIDTKLVKELLQISDSDTYMTIGSNVSLNQLITELEKRTAESVTYSVMAKHIRKVANVPVRNVGSWIGNLSMKRLHPEFPSDIFTLFEAFSATLSIKDCKTGSVTERSLTGNNGFLSLDMTGKVVLSAKLPKVTAAAGIAREALSYKVMPRSQNAHAYINSAFTAEVQDGKIGNPSIVFGGVSKTFVHALNTEKYLIGKAINSQEVLDGAVKVLRTELKPVSYSAADSSTAYRLSLSLGLFYKFYLSLCTELSPSVQSAVDIIERPLTSGTQSYDSNASMYPVSEPMPKVTAIKQASGEAKYITDSAPTRNELFISLVTATVGNADIDAIDSSAASSLPGFHSIITASDFPDMIQNTYTPPPFANQPILAESHVDFAGQPIALALADSQDHADAIAKAVTVTYKNQQEPVTDMEEAMEKKMMYPGAGDPVIIGDADTAIQNAAHKVSGRIRIGSQYHFYMETQVARALPTEEGFDIESATQWQDLVQSSLSNILGWDCNRFNIITPRIGGAYGGKATNSLIGASFATVASYISGRPVRCHVDLSHCLETYGSRSAYIADYTVGFTNDGILQGIDITYNSNSGASVNDGDVTPDFLKQFGDSGYHCPNWKMTPKWVKTNIASATWCRAPVSAQVTMIMEIILEHVAKTLNSDPIPIKQSNLYVKDQLNLFGEPLTYCSIRSISETLLTNSHVDSRQAEVSAFNGANKWKKRGIGFTPVKFGIIYAGANYGAQISIFHTDGSVILTTAGTEVGQGLYTKITQVASYILGAPMDLIRVNKSVTSTTPNGAPTGGSLASELCCKAVLEACKVLKARIDAVKSEISESLSWKDLIAKCYNAGVDLTEHRWEFAHPGSTVVKYNCYGAACSEVELDVLTGEFVIKRVDILYDCGQSINPEIDVGQAEGAFLMGVGFYTSEKMAFDSVTGQLATNSTWEYKPPTSKDIPTVWNVSFLKDAPNPVGVLSSKAVGEPPLCTSASVVFAIKRCIEAFKQDKSYFPIDLPATVDNIQQLCKVSDTDFKI